ncbi:MAG: hypothetical protein HN741_00075, partial [Anaerolineae bacterium]|nr:hypothetical protein [Anaerolineae bacterium]
KIVSEIKEKKEVDPKRLSALIDRAFEVLEHAAQEIPDMDEIRKKYNQKGNIK